MQFFNNVAVFGANGFVGRNLKLGDDALLFDNFFLSNDKDPQVQLGDITKLDENNLADNFRKRQIDTVINLAAIHHIPYCNSNPEEAIFANVFGNLKLYEFCQRFGIRHYVFASSGAVYQPSTHLHAEGDHLESSDIYSSTKLLSEQHMSANAIRNDMKVTALRFFNIVGAHDYTPHLIPDLFDQCSNKTAHVEVGNLDTVRDYIHVSDVVELIRRVILSDLAYKYEAINVCTGVGHTGHEVLQTIQAAMTTNKLVKIASSKLRKSDRPSQIGNYDLAKKLFNWQPKLQLKDGIADYVNWKRQ